jgi:hypothetical protein
MQENKEQEIFEVCKKNDSECLKRWIASHSDCS